MFLLLKFVFQYVLLMNCIRYAAFPRRSMGPSRQYFFILFFCFLILPVWEDFSFCLLSCEGEILTFVHFPYIVECCFSFLCFLVCVGGDRLSIDCPGPSNVPPIIPPTYLPPTHSIETENHEKKRSRMQERSSGVENFSPLECKQKKNRLK